MSVQLTEKTVETAWRLEKHDAQEIAKSLEGDDEDGWTYMAICVLPQWGEYIIGVSDENGDFLGYL